MLRLSKVLKHLRCFQYVLLIACLCNLIKQSNDICPIIGYGCVVLETFSYDWRLCKLVGLLQEVAVEIPEQCATSAATFHESSKQAKIIFHIRGRFVPINQVFAGFGDALVPNILNRRVQEALGIGTNCGCYHLSEINSFCARLD